MKRRERYKARTEAIREDVTLKIRSRSPLSPVNDRSIRTPNGIFPTNASLALIYRKCIDYESCSIQVASVGRSVEREEIVSIKLQRNAWNIRFYLLYLAVFIHLRDVNTQLSVPYIECPLYTRYRYDRFCCNDRRRRRRPRR